MSSQAKAEAQAHAEQLARQIQAEEAKVQQQVSSEISEVKSPRTPLTPRLPMSPPTSAASRPRSPPPRPNSRRPSRISRARSGDLGVQSGLIATNASELQALKRLGERNYFEFKLGKTKDRQRVGDITLLLKKTDPKKNKYTVEVMADDKLTEKKDKNVNEPIQFYTSKARQPYEIVVNQVQKDLIVGYLATPKEQSGKTR